MNIFKLFIVNENSCLTTEELNTVLQELKNNSGEILRQLEYKVNKQIEVQQKYMNDPSSEHYRHAYETFRQ